MRADFWGQDGQKSLARIATHLLSNSIVKASEADISFFLQVDMYDLIMKCSLAVCMETKQPDIFCCTFVIRMSRSPALLNK